MADREKKSGRWKYKIGISRAGKELFRWIKKHFS